jgi:beta-RFAP synthase
MGTGTQLGLAVAQALTMAWRLEPIPVVELARRVGRGRRSGLGVHGFEQGGFLVDGGKRDTTAVAPLVVRLAFPEDWRIVLIVPAGEKGTHGTEESEAFHRLGDAGVPVEWTEGLCRLVLLGLLPALSEADLDAFSEALHDFNARAGRMFAAVQGGTYATPRLGQLVEFIRRQGVRGTGQSSWGPTVLAVTADEDQARHLVGRVRVEFHLEASEVMVTAACNQGATVTAADEH